MLRSLFISIRGGISIFLYAANLLIHAAIILCVTPIVLLTPMRSWRHAIQKYFLQKTPASFAYLNYCIMQISAPNHLAISGVGELKKGSWYVMISNHRSWLDILVLGSSFYDKIPPLKFFMKKELLWQLPLAGVACYVLGYPFMSRHSHAEIRKNPSLKGKDTETTKKACQRLRLFPSTLINFLEGTRYTKSKSERQESPFKHILKPHAGGVAVAIQELHDVLSGIVNVTIYYPKKTPSVWDFACGRFEKISVHYELLPITPDLIGNYYNDRVFRTHMQQYLNDVWQRKDTLLDSQA